MGRDANSRQAFQTYGRLISFARPYWKMLTIGILCGVLVGGSMFVALVMVPRLVNVAETNISGAGDNLRRSGAARKIVETLKDDALTDAEKQRAVEKILKPDDRDPQLTKLVEQAKKTVRTFGLPCKIEGYRIEFFWPKHFTFSLVEADGRVAWQLFAVYGILFLLAWIFKCIAKYFNGYCTRRVGAQVIADLREKIFTRLINQSLSFYGDSDVGQLISRCTNDTSAMEDAISHSIEDLTGAPLQIAACVVAIIVACRENNSFTLAIILFIGLPLIFVPFRILGNKIRRIYHACFGRIADVFSRMHETFSCIKVVKAYNTEKREEEVFRDANREYLREVFRGITFQQLLSPMMELVSVLAVSFFILYSYRDGITVTQLTALLAPALMASRPIKELSKVIVMIQKSMAASDRFFALLDEDCSLPEKPGAVELKDFQSEIRLDRVVFRYESNTVIDDMSFSLPKGKIFAVVGETGSGKTTVANLIARFYDVSGGRITIDGIDVRDYTISSLRAQIGVVTQEALLFNDTIANNIAYGKKDATREEIEKAAKLANAHDFIVDGHHEEGYDTVVGEKGFKLSGGEKQRISIARAILRNPPILILDEATSALDTITERLVQDALNRVMRDRTVFVIAHRLSTIQNADRILVLDRGKIVECGTHDELLTRNGMYRKLHDTQFGAL
ncbi:MAG: ABC transporter ATP-binding protein/permease [Victivallaceae bacterium]|nr:ABC transporter ATP-binding protein/permease [Victivallaceae bacterium]